MATYILLMTLTPEGQLMALDDPEYLLSVEKAIPIAGLQTLGVYGVLGQYDYVTMVEAESNEVMARFSIELGVKAGVHITTLPVVPAARLEVSSNGDNPELSTAQALDAPTVTELERDQTEGAVGGRSGEA